MTLFRPCIDLHDGRVKQIVGGTLNQNSNDLEINFVSDRSAGHYAEIYKKDALQGGHVIQLNKGNEVAATEALTRYPGGLQIGGGIHPENAANWLEAGASHVIVTSWLFGDDGTFLPDRLDRLVSEIGRDRLVVDLSCRSSNDSGWRVMMNRWQTSTNLAIDAGILREISGYCSEFLIHAADVEGKCEGIDSELVQFLGAHCPIPVTYAGGANSLTDLAQVEDLSSGRVDLTIGSALDLFGGVLVRYADCVAWNRRNT